VPSREYAEAIEREWAEWQSHPAWDASPVVETIYFGGGTPSRLDPAALARLFGRIREDRPVAPEAEITLEANPDDVDPEHASAWRGIGVNRISLGAQSFQPDVLAWMHRTHDAPRIGGAVRTLRAAGFEDISLDLIYALPVALHRSWADDLEQALALTPTHLSLYNSAYWRRAPFIGLGPSAHSGFGSQRRWNVREWEEYHRRAERGERVMSEAESLSPEQVALEDLYLGLRTLDGVPESLVPAAAAGRWIGKGWARLRGGRLALTASGWLRLDALVASLSHC
jgi:oxygen-independent coproporphyrinogen-3 oxidase